MVYYWWCLRRSGNVRNTRLTCAAYLQHRWAIPFYFETPAPNVVERTKYENPWKLDEQTSCPATSRLCPGGFAFPMLCSTDTRPVALTAKYLIMSYPYEIIVYHIIIVILYDICWYLTSFIYSISSDLTKLRNGFGAFTIFQKPPKPRFHGRNTTWLDLILDLILDPLHVIPVLGLGVLQFLRFFHRCLELLLNRLPEMLKFTQTMFAISLLG